MRFGTGSPFYGFACARPGVYQCVGSNRTGKDNDWNVSPRTMEEKFGESCEKAESKSQSDVALPARSIPFTATDLRPHSSDLTLSLGPPDTLSACNTFPCLHVKMTKTPKTHHASKSGGLDERSSYLPRPSSTENPDQECSFHQVTKDFSVQRGTSVSYLGTIPRLVITPSPGSGPQSRDMGESLDQHADEESPCSDSGCGGSPVPSISFRKLSSSSSTCLSSASSFEESEDDMTGSDLEPNSLSPGAYNMLGRTPDDVTGVSSRQYNTIIA